MPTTLELCEQFYGTRDVYKLFEVDKKAPEKEIKKAYYKLSLKVHPDRVTEQEKEEATEKFKVLSRIYSVLSDKDKRILYDEKGIIDDDDDMGDQWLSMWKHFFKPISSDDITTFEKSYIGSELERNDIKKSYLNGKGCINFMINHVPFMDCEDEPRIAEIVKKMIASGEVPEYKAFTEEPKSKRDRRHKKYAKEARETQSLKEKQNNNQGLNSLEQQIQIRMAGAQRFNNFVDNLAKKYGNCNDESDAVEYIPLKKGATPAKSAKTKRQVKTKGISKK